MPRRQPQLKQPHIPCAYRPRNSMGKRPVTKSTKSTVKQEEPVMKKPAAWHCIDEQDEVVNDDDEQQEQEKEQKIFYTVCQRRERR